MVERKEKILVVDDELAIIKLLRSELEASGRQALAAMDGAEALQIVEREPPDLIILDIMMPNIDGLEVCRRLREWSQIPIIIVSVKEATEEKVNCLDIGADDYITKPFDVDELMARVRAVLRRSQTVRSIPSQPVFTAGDLEIDFVKRQVTYAHNEVKCTPTEYSLLQELVLNVGKVLTHTHLLRRVWGPEYGGEKEYLRVFVNRLRVKLESDPRRPRYIITIPNVGYMFNRRAPAQT